MTLSMTARTEEALYVTQRVRAAIDGPAPALDHAIKLLREMPDTVDVEDAYACIRCHRCLTPDPTDHLGRAQGLLASILGIEE